MRRRNRGFSSYKARKPRRVWKILVGVFAVVLLAAGWAAWKVMTPYQPDEAARAVMAAGAEGVTVEEREGWISYAPAKAAGASVILYPGALVEPESYAPLAYRLAEAGHHSVIVKMPYNLPITAPDSADQVVQAYPDETFVIGGHSLGGVMAARYAAAHTDTIKGLFLLASYADAKGDIHQSGLPVLSVLGTEDGVIDMKSYQEGRSMLPADTLYYTVQGGNHAQFGSYGPQKGDGTASISEEDQLNQTSAVLLDWISDKAPIK